MAHGPLTTLITYMAGSDGVRTNKAFAIDWSLRPPPFRLNYVRADVVAAFWNYYNVVNTQARIAAGSKFAVGTVVVDGVNISNDGYTQKLCTLVSRANVALGSTPVTIAKVGIGLDQSDYKVLSGLGALFKPESSAIYYKRGHLITNSRLHAYINTYLTCPLLTTDTTFQFGNFGLWSYHHTDQATMQRSLFNWIDDVLISNGP